MLDTSFLSRRVFREFSSRLREIDGAPRAFAQIAPHGVG
jgi:hypothetical protein